MYKTLRRESLKRVLPRVIVCFAVAALLLGLCAGGLVKLAAGPKPLTEATPYGAYVEFDASEIIVGFATLSVKDGDGGTQVQETYYLLPVGENKYMAVMDARERNAAVIEKAMEQSHEYYLGDLETLTALGPLRGTVRVIDEEMLPYMADCIDNYGLPGSQEGQDSSRLLVYSQVDLDWVGLFGKGTLTALSLLGLAALLLGLAQLIVTLAGCYQRQVRATVQGDGGFDGAAAIERTRVGRYIWYTKGAGSRAIPTEDVVWGYAMPEPLVVSKYRWPVALYDREQRLTRIDFMEQKSCQAFLEAVAAQGQPFHLGYSSQAAEQFSQDFPGFLAEAEREAAARRSSTETEA